MIDLHLTTFERFTNKNPVKRKTNYLFYSPTNK